MEGAMPGPVTQAVIDVAGLQRLLDVLNEDHTVVGPVVRDGAIVLGELSRLDDLPRGIGDEQEPGRYRLRKRADDAYFGYAALAQPWKRLLFPPAEKVVTTGLDGDRFTAKAADPAPPRPYALLGVRGRGGGARSGVPQPVPVDRGPRGGDGGGAGRGAADHRGLARRAPAPHVQVRPRAGTGHGGTEAPRGLLYHRYVIDDGGTIVDAKIVPPTSQNQSAIEEDLHAFVQPRLDLADDELTRQCEQAIRNYDPCISCSAHFLDLTVERIGVPR